MALATEGLGEISLIHYENHILMNSRKTEIFASYPDPMYGLRLPSRFYSDSEVHELRNHFSKGYLVQGRHILVRHGESEANVCGISCERLDEDVNKCGLTARGREQVQRGAQNLIRALFHNQSVIILSSPLLRARQSAEIVHRALSCSNLDIQSEMIISDGISERFYGDMNGLPYAAFRELVACQDRRAPFKGLSSCESALELIDRVTRTIVTLDTVLSAAYRPAPLFIYCTHLMVIKAAVAASKGLSPQELHDAIEVENGGVVTLF